MMPMPHSPPGKHDVIHYIREEYLKKHNLSQLSKVDESYLPAAARHVSN